MCSRRIVRIARPAADRQIMHDGRVIGSKRPPPPRVRYPTQRDLTTLCTGQPDSVGSRPPGRGPSPAPRSSLTAFGNFLWWQTVTN